MIHARCQVALPTTYPGWAGGETTGSVGLRGKEEICLLHCTESVP